MESLKNHYPTSFVMYPEMERLKAAPCPEFLKQLIKGVLTMYHMDGAAPLP